MMRMSPTTKEENTLSNLSELLNCSITAAEMIEDARRSEHVKIQVQLNELFALYQTSKMMYIFTCEGERDVNILNFFTAFDEFYFELKHFYLYETNAFKRDFNLAKARLDEMKKTFATIIDHAHEGK